ncbi:AsmA-like C-terminal region-containing protein [Aurantimonas sp. VKM B-3413]|uniref:AsmA family protein n=1 Tax=Aurantimonas sp. VKM B-3413 TaxID=2779401 RepID=UPI002106D728|nr:AsmA-like C-terminal region-containing protein [Aurantimonas sp. VKM B-3413]MCB8835886.1 AsmA family protein [Aurantimonas sp. VKM B-3413]
MVRAFVFVGGLLVLALLGALVAPYFIDWTAYRADFEREASRILGRKVIVRGEASARLLPFPSVTFEDVEVGGDAGKPLLTVDRFRMDAELAPYLSGEIFIYSMTLDHPTIRIPVGADGAISWVVDQPHIPTGATVVLQSVGIENGEVEIENAASGRTERLNDVDATLSAATLAGPVDGSGSFSVGGETVDFTLSLGTVQDDGSMPVRVEAANHTLSTKVTLDGSATLDGHVPNFKGAVGIQRPVPELAGLSGEASDGTRSPFESLAGAQSDGASQDTPQGPAVPPLRAAGAIRLTPQSAELSDLRVEAGPAPQPYVLNGKGSLDFGKSPSFALSLKGEQVNVDALASGEGSSSSEAAPAGSAIGLPERVEALRSVLAQIPRPTIPGEVVVNLPVVLAGDTTIRDVAFTASPTGGGWSVDGFSAELPGRTRIEASGTVGLEPSFSFEGDLLVASQQPSGFSSWLTGEIDPAIRTLSRAGFSAKTVLTPERQVFNGLELDIGGDTLTGRLERTEMGEHTKISSKLSGGAVDLDAFFALTKILTGQSDSLANADRFDVALKAGPVTFDDVKADVIDADVLYDGDMLSIGKLDVEGIAGATVTASGRLTDLKSEAKGKLDVDLTSAAPSRFFTFLHSRLPGIPLVEVLSAKSARLAPLALSGQLEATDGDAGKKPSLLVRLKGTADGTTIDLSSAIENGIYARQESGRFGLDLTLKNDKPAILLGQLGVPAAEIDAPSPLQVELSLSAAETGPAVASASLRAPGSEVSVDGVLDVTPNGVTRADMSVYLKSEDAGPWLRTAAVDLGQSFDSVPVDVNGDVVYDVGEWTLRGVSGTIAGNDVAVDIHKSVGGAFDGKAHVSTLSLPWVANLVFGEPLQTAISGPLWPKKPFRASLLPDSEFDVAVTADSLDTGAGSLQDFSAEALVTGSQLSFEKARLSLPGGELSGRLALRNAGGLGGLTLEAKSSGFDLSAVFPQLAAGEGGGSLSGNIRLDGSGQSYAGLVSALTGAGSVSVTDAQIPGVPPAIFSPLLEAADESGFKPQGDTKATFVGLAKGTSFPVPSASSEFAVTGGTVRFAPTTVASQNEQLRLETSLDLASLTLDGEMQLSLDPGLDRVEGATPVVVYDVAGKLFDPALSIDATALVNYLSVRALEQEQARVEQMQESLQEKLRLRREARFYRWRTDEAERVEAERKAAEEAARAKAAAEEAAAAAAKAEREARAKAAAEAARKDAERAASGSAADRPAEKSQPSERAPQPEKPSAGTARDTPAIDFNTAVPGASTGGEASFPSLPGVKGPLEF